MKTSRVNVVNPTFDESMTKTSKFIRLLSRVCFLTVIQKDDKILFSKFKTCIYFLVNICWFFVIATVSIKIDAVGVQETYNKEVNDWKDMLSLHMKC